MDVGFLPFSLVEETFHWRLLDFCDICPFLVVLSMRSSAEAMILEDLLVFFFGENGVKGMFLFNSPFFVVDQLFSLGLDDLVAGYTGDGHDDFFGMGGVGEGRRVGVLQFKQISQMSDSGGRRVLPKILLNKAKNLLHLSIIYLFKKTT